MMSFLFSKKSTANYVGLPSAEISKNISERTFLVVGGTKGIGASCVKALVKNGAARVVVVGRSTPQELLDSFPGMITFIPADLNSVKGSFKLAKDLQGRTFDTVVFTTGIITKNELTRNSEGIEEDLMISYLSRFILINELIRSQAINGRKRIIIYGYPGQKLTPLMKDDDINFEKTEYKQWPAHMNTVIFNEALVYEAAKRFPDYHFFEMNPGLLPTGIRDNLHGGNGTFMGKTIEKLISLVSWTVDQYVENTLIQVIANPALNDQTALCFDQKGNELPLQGWVEEPTNREKAWFLSEQLVKQAKLTPS